MILTCPACGTSYTVKDGAIPAAGRQVRCASCKHSWHQAGDAPPTDPAIDEIPAAQPEAAPPEPIEPSTAETPPPAYEHGASDDTGSAAHAMAADVGDHEAVADVPFPADEPIAPAETEALSTIDMSVPLAADPVAASSDGYDWEHGRDSAPAPRRGRGLIVVLALIVVVGALAAAAWFLAPPEWLARAGIAQDSASSPLKLMVTSQDRQKLASGNDLVSLSGRVINPTDATQNVPPLQADLRNGAGKLVYSWTIAPPAASLPPRASASFNAAELGVPADATSLTLRWAS